MKPIKTAVFLLFALVFVLNTGCKTRKTAMYTTTTTVENVRDSTVLVPIAPLAIVLKTEMVEGRLVVTSVQGAKEGTTFEVVGNDILVSLPADTVPTVIQVKDRVHTVNNEAEPEVIVKKETPRLFIGLLGGLLAIVVFFGFIITRAIRR